MKKLFQAALLSITITVVPVASSCAAFNKAAESEEATAEYVDTVTTTVESTARALGVPEPLVWLLGAGAGGGVGWFLNRKRKELAAKKAAAAEAGTA